VTKTTTVWQKVNGTITAEGPSANVVMHNSRKRAQSTDGSQPPNNTYAVTAGRVTAAPRSSDEEWKVLGQFSHVLTATAYPSPRTVAAGHITRTARSLTPKCHTSRRTGGGTISLVTCNTEFLQCEGRHMTSACEAESRRTQRIPHQSGSLPCPASSPCCSLGHQFLRGPLPSRTRSSA
jgi:hypothetical protein